MILYILAAILTALVLGFIFTPTMGKRPRGDREDRCRRSPNYRGTRFVNLESTKTLRPENPGILYEFIFGASRKPAKPLPVHALTASDFPSTPADLQVVWMGHSSFILDIEGVRILVDAVFGKYASPFPGLMKRFQPPPLRLDQVPPVDAVLISHNHYDHLEMKTIRRLAAMGTVFITPLGVGSYLESWGCASSQIIELDWWQSHSIGGVTLTAAPSQHFSGRGAFDANKALWASWAITGARRRVFYSSDGGYGFHFEEIGRRLGPFDLTLMECGAYNKQWADIHMIPEESVRAHLDVRGEYMLPVHWALFDLSLHTWDEPIRRAAAEAQRLGVRLATPMIGEMYSPGMTTGCWWENPRS